MSFKVSLSFTGERSIKLTDPKLTKHGHKKEQSPATKNYETIAHIL